MKSRYPRRWSEDRILERAEREAYQPIFCAIRVDKGGRWVERTEPMTLGESMNYAREHGDALNGIGWIGGRTIATARRMMGQEPEIDTTAEDRHMMADYLRTRSFKFQH